MSDLLGVGVAVIVATLLGAVVANDLRYHRIPDRLVIGIGGAAAIGAVTWPNRDLLETTAGGALALGVATVVYRLGRWGGTVGVGLGDVKLAAVGGMIVGLAHTVNFLLASATVGGGVALLLLILGKRRRDRFAYGPCLIAGMGIALVLSAAPVLSLWDRP